MKKLINTHQKIFVAGHNGMVGRSIIRNLRNKNYKNLIYNSREELDLTESRSVNEWFRINKPEVVIIAAAKVGGINANNTYPVDFLLENLKIQNNIIENAWKNNARRLLFLGSSCIYPKKTPQPIKEEYLLDSQLELTNKWYAIAKITGIKLCEALRIQYNFDAISLMPTNLYGPYDNYHPENSHVLPALIKKFYDAYKNNSKEVICWGSGNPYREFLHVDDLGDACIYALENWQPGLTNSPKDKNGNSLSYINVGTGQDISIKDLATLIAEIVGFKGIIKWDSNKPDGTLRKRLDISRFTELGWKAKIKLKDGIKRTVDDYKKELREGKLRQI
tara:strand:- start:20711 stop:21712 length:1002 start_codon:yes stop_codon:yes gene_type:complete